MANERGAFRGELDVVDGRTFERVPRAVVEYLLAGGARPSIAPSPAEAGRAAIVPFVANEGRGAVSYDADLATLMPLPQTGIGRSQLFAALADVAAALRALHASGHLHGMLRPDVIRITASGAATLLTPAHPVDAYALHVASMKSGAIDLASSAFLAPELLAGAAASTASDAYSLAACAYHALTGELPVGQLDIRHAARGAPDGAADVLHDGLLAAPFARPHLQAIELALRDLSAAFTSDATSPIPPSVAEPLPASSASRAESPVPPSVAAPVHAPPSRSEVSAVLVVVLIVGGLFVLTGALWLVAISWDALGHAGHLALLLLLSFGALGAGERCRMRGLDRAALTLTALGSQLFWADGAYLLSIQTERAGADSWAVVAGVVTVISLAFAVHRRSTLLARAAAIDFAIASACFGVHLKSGAPLGPTLYSAAVACAYVAIAAAGEAWLGRAVGVPFAVGAVLASLLSALCAFVLLAGNLDATFATAWPYVIIAALTLPWLLHVRAPYAELGAVAALVLLTATPTVEALIEHDDVLYLVAAVAIGGVTATAAFVAPRFSNVPDLQVAMTWVGVTSVIGGPGFFALAHLSGERSIFYLALALGVGGFLVVLSYVLSARSASKAAHRALEAAGLVLFFGLLTIDSVVKLDSWTYPGLVLLGAAVMLALGMTMKRAAPVSIAATALLINVWLQYFVKLFDRVPVSLLCVGFGLSLLVGGVVFEKKMRPLLPTMREWA